MGLAFKISKYLILVILSLVPLIWLTGKSGVLINGVDTNFPLDPLLWLERRFFVWNHVVNAGIDFSSSTAGLFFHLIQTIPYQLGFSLQAAQLISLVFWFSVTVFNSFLVAKTIIPGNFLAQILFVIFYSFNPYLFNTWENVKVANLSLIASIPAALTIIIALNRGEIGKKKAAFMTALVAVILSGSGINPSYFFVFFAVLVIFFLGTIIAKLNLKSVILLTRNFLLVSLVIILVNLFWILPTANFILKNISPSGSIDKLGFTNWIDSLSENTSLLNVMRVQGAWDWYAFDAITGLPLYIPYVLNYFYKIPFIVFSFLIPALAIFSLIFRKNTKAELYFAFGLMFTVGIFLGSGTHLPTGEIYRYLSDHIPFFTIFRSPWYIFTPLVILSTAGLVALLFERLTDSLKTKGSRIILVSFALILMFSNLLYNYPLISGKIFRSDRVDSFYIKFPDYLFQSKKWLSENDDTRMVSYPNDDLEKFNWGYIGIESILELFSDQEVLFSSFNMQNSPIADLLKEFYKNLKREKLDATFSLASKLNIGWIFNKQDQSTIIPPLPGGFKNLPKTTFGKWEFYRLPKTKPLQKIAVVEKTLFAYPYKNSAEVFGLVDDDQVVLNPDDRLVDKISSIVKYSDVIILADNSQAESFKLFKFAMSNLADRLQIRDLSKVSYTFYISTEGMYNLVLERDNLEDFGIDLTGATLEIDYLSGSFVHFKPRFFSKGQHKISLSLQNKNLISGGSFDEGVTYKEGGYGEGKGTYEIKDEGSGKFLSILNVKKADVSADFTVSSFNKFNPYYVELKYKQIYGNNALALVGQNNKDTLIKAQVERLPNYPEWNSFSFYYEPIETDSIMKVVLSAPFTKDPLGTKIFYDDLKVYKVFTNNMFLIRKNNLPVLGVPKISSKKINPTLYEGEVTEGENAHIIVFAENYSPDWEISLYRRNGLKIPFNPPHFSANLYANAWYIADLPKDYRFKIQYKPQKLFILGGAISLITLATTALIFIIFTKRRYEKNN